MSDPSLKFKESARPPIVYNATFCVMVKKGESSSWQMDQKYNAVVFFEERATLLCQKLFRNREKVEVPECFLRLYAL